MKKIEARRNGNGGVDLITEDENNTVLIMTGNRADSSEFWERMRNTCDIALREMQVDEDAEYLDNP